jgi:hypothetical protein
MYRCNLFRYKDDFCVSKRKIYIDVIIKYIGIVFTQRALNKMQKEKKTCEEKISKKNLKHIIII